MDNEKLEERVEQIYREAKTSYLSRERRYALLQAAATIRAAIYSGDHGSNGPFWESVQEAVSEAEALLAEIEQREKK